MCICRIIFLTGASNAGGGGGAWPTDGDECHPGPSQAIIGDLSTGPPWIPVDTRGGGFGPRNEATDTELRNAPVKRASWSSRRTSAECCLEFNGGTDSTGKPAILIPNRATRGGKEGDYGATQGSV